MKNYGYLQSRYHPGFAIPCFSSGRKGHIGLIIPIYYDSSVKRAHRQGVKLDLTVFFREQGIDLFSEVNLDNLSEVDRSTVVQFFPSAQSVIVFGREVPVPVYRSPPKEKTRGMLRIAEALDATAVRLAAHLEVEQVPAMPVPLYLPVTITGGKVQGIVRLKHVAAAAGLGSLGRNTLLFNTRFGPRLLLSGVVSGSRVQEFRQAGTDAGSTKDPACKGCGRCISLCPGGALGAEGADAFRCRTISAVVPALLIPVAKWMLGRTILLRYLAPLAPWIARTATIRCSLCVTECPNFSGGGAPET
jgi:epoxyqueuosine reductase